MRSSILLFLFAAGTAPIATASAHGPAATASAIVRDASGKAVGEATFVEKKGGVEMKLRAHDLPAGTHGLHLHMTGLCEGPEFKSAGGHWNPTGKVHGMKAPGGAHEGDLPNLEIGGNGRGRVTALVKGATIAGGALPINGADGTALVIHATADDYMTDPSGNSGGRIACGVVK